MLSRARSRYRVTPGVARTDLEESLRKMRVRQFVVTSDLSTRIDGRPRAGAREPLDPGIAVWWFDRTGARRVIACDQWRTTYENMRAICLTLEALRQVERSGASQLLDRTMQAFAAKLLGSGDASSAAHTWWFARLGLETWPPSDGDVTAAYRRLAKVEHPDVGGNAEKFRELALAFGAAREWLAGREREAAQ